ncbi:hypothetical protein D6D28_03180 [Aureobasidium pullulans]|uniref:Uncharacterized protein n=1 Tax=Aureobasidium pullulans TaxID=5580 RepID=A0A4S8SRX6_AURPU|nr:hypothetical protein D6D28_03180 [Aureobasidium pullulans]
MKINQYDASEPSDLSESKPKSRISEILKGRLQALMGRSQKDKSTKAPSSNQRDSARLPEAPGARRYNLLNRPSSPTPAAPTAPLSPPRVSPLIQPTVKTSGSLTLVAIDKDPNVSGDQGNLADLSDHAHVENKTCPSETLSCYLDLRGHSIEYYRNLVVSKLQHHQWYTAETSRDWYRTTSSLSTNTSISTEVQRKK